MAISAFGREDVVVGLSKPNVQATASRAVRTGWWDAEEVAAVAAVGFGGRVDDLDELGAFSVEPDLRSPRACRSRPGRGARRLRFRGSAASRAARARRAAAPGCRSARPARRSGRRGSRRACAGTAMPSQYQRPLPSGQTTAGSFAQCSRPSRRRSRGRSIRIVRVSPPRRQRGRGEEPGGEAVRDLDEERQRGDARVCAQ